MSLLADAILTLSIELNYIDPIAHPDSDLIVGRSAGQVEGDQESMSSSELASFKLI